MNAALFRKELRELLPWAILGLAVGVVEPIEALTGQIDMRPLGATIGLLNGMNALLYWFIAFAIGTGLVTRERDEGTLAFLDGLPLSRGRAFAIKCAVMALIVLIAPLLHVATIVFAHLLSRGSLDQALHLPVLLKGLALIALLVVNGLMLGAALGRLRSLTWLVAGVLAVGLLLLAEQLPRSAILNPASLLDWQWTGTGFLIAAETVQMQIAITIIAFLLAWRGFVHTGRSRLATIGSRPVLGALVSFSTVATVLAVVVIIVLRNPAPVTGPSPGTAPSVQFAPSPPAQTVTRHFRISYPAHEAEAALALAAEADAIFERVHAVLGVPPGERIDVDASGSMRNTHGTAFFGRLRMTLASEVAPVLAHEVAHVVADRAAGGQSAWLWNAASVLNEGLASYIESMYRAPSTRAEDRMMVLAALHTRRELLIDELARPGVLAAVRDENLKYSAGEVLIRAMVRVYGDESIPRLLASFADPALPTNLTGPPLWQGTFQLAGMDLAAVSDEFYRTVATFADANAERIATLPRPRVRLVRSQGYIGVLPQFDRTVADAARQREIALRLKPEPDSPLSLVRAESRRPGQPAWIDPTWLGGGRVCIQPGIAIGGETLFEPWICLPVGDAVEWDPAAAE